MRQHVELLQFPLLVEGIFFLFALISKHFIHMKAVRFVDALLSL
jgi:hypothetical protein